MLLAACDYCTLATVHTIYLYGESIMVAENSICGESVHLYSPFCHLFDSFCCEHKSIHYHIKLILTFKKLSRWNINAFVVYLRSDVITYPPKRRVSAIDFFVVILSIVWGMFRVQHISPFFVSERTSTSCLNEETCVAHA
jgi:hypothetical protein